MNREQACSTPYRSSARDRADTDIFRARGVILGECGHRVAQSIGVAHRNDTAFLPVGDQIRASRGIADDHGSSASQSFNRRSGATLVM